MLKHDSIGTPFMNDQNNTQPINFSRPMLKLIRSTLEKRISELTQESDKINAELRLHRETLNNILMISDSIGTTEEDELDVILQSILAGRTEGLKLHTIITEYIEITKTPITREYLLRHLQKRKGILYEVIGERGGAKWKLIEHDNNSEEVPESETD
jgi:hypothetical protein